MLTIGILLVGVFFALVAMALAFRSLLSNHRRAQSLRRLDRQEFRRYVSRLQDSSLGDGVQ